jgi:hypothetical protein
MFKLGHNASPFGLRQPGRSRDGRLFAVMLLGNAVAHGAIHRAAAWTHVPAEFERGGDRPVFVFALVQETRFKCLAKSQVLFVQRTELLFADDVGQPAHALDVGVAREQLARERRMILARVAFAHAVFHQPRRLGNRRLAGKRLAETGRDPGQSDLR